ncbi:MAG: serine hydrolase [Ignavibacteriaceae bacterium]|nr:serine hydrolase [Ignavibacteriaceae bacterium]
MESVKVLLITLTCVVLFANYSHPRDSTQTLSSNFDLLLTDAFNKNIFSGILTVARDGKVIYYMPMGYADWNTKRPFTKNTLFNIGSLNKQFTEEMIHQLVKENKLDYDDKLNRYVTLYYLGIGDKITIKQLLDMSAGLGDYLIDTNFIKIKDTNFSLGDLLGIIENEPLQFEPGKGNRYSNSGYVVLGAVIEKITGKSYEDNLRERIIEPLGLKNIYYTKSEKVNQKDRAFGTLIDFDGNKKSFDDISNSTPAGGIYTTIEDLLNFAEAKRYSKLPSGQNYGLGSFAGGTQLWNCTISYNEETGYSYVVAANVGKIADELSKRIGSIIADGNYPPLQFPFDMTLYQIILKKGESYIKENGKSLAQQAGLPYDDHFLNYFGYQYLNAGKTDIAIMLFKINTELFPNVSNTFDSYAEALAKKGDKQNALLNYKKALSLDPQNARIQNRIRDLEMK